MEHIKIDDKHRKIIEDKFKCYIKVTFPNDTKLKTKQILDFYYKNQQAIFQKAKKLSENCSSKNVGGSKTRSKTKSKYKYKTKSKTRSKSRSKKGGDILEMVMSVVLITMGMWAAAIVVEMVSLSTSSDDNLEVGTEEQYPRDQIYHSRSRNRIVATPRNRIVATPRNRTTRPSQQGTSFDLYNRRYHNSDEDY